MDTIMELNKVSKCFKEKSILSEVSLAVHNQEIIALIGKNGSGKSTLLKVMIGLLKPTSGTVIRHTESIGYVPELPPAYAPFTVTEYLGYLGRISGIEKKALSNKIAQLISLFQLEDAQSVKLPHLSKGMKQKVAIMQAMLKEVDLLILDEPLSGLDVKTQTELEDTLSRLKANGMSIIFTCHENKLLESLADRVLLLDKGCIEETGTLRNGILQNQLIFQIPLSVAIEEFTALEIVKREITEHNGYEVEAIMEAEETDRILQQLLEQGASIKQLQPLLNPIAKGEKKA